MQKRHLIGLLCLLISGCTHVAPQQLAFSPDYTLHRDAESRALEGEACSWSFLGFLKSGDAGVRRAMESVGGSSEKLVLTWVAVDLATTNYLIAKRSCTLVTAYFVARPRELSDLPDSGKEDRNEEADDALDAGESEGLPPSKLPERADDEPARTDEEGPVQIDRAN